MPAERITWTAYNDAQAGRSVRRILESVLDLVGLPDAALLHSSFTLPFVPPPDFPHVLARQPG